ncbi:MAG: septum formation inhibitor [Oscillospiraceae bacterium]|nr:septum formation inhibitor [Oscillospiraceae bacterium]
MAYRDDNLAYDLSVYEPKSNVVPKTQPKAEPKAKPRIEIRRNTIALPQNLFTIFLTAAVVFAVMFALLYGKVETNRLFGEITTLESQLSELESDNASLAAEYESKTSLKSVEEYAQNVLGLEKLDKSQIEYVEVEGDTVIEVVETESSNIFVIIKNWFDDLFEYLGF